MKAFFCLVFAICLTCAALGQSSITLMIDTKASGITIPPDLIGVSFGPSALQKHVFDSSNTQLLTIFRELGIKYFRMGGTMVDTNDSNYTPTTQDIDAFFRFIKASGIDDVIYTLRLENGNGSRDASTADYIWKNYSQYLNCFAIGNEPNLYKDGDPEITDFTSYLAKWRKFAAAIRNTVPAAKLGGPDTTGTSPWTAQFADAEAGRNTVSRILTHWYVGGNPKGKSAEEMIDEMLSPNWDSTRYPAFYAKSIKPAVSHGFPYYITEANDFTAGKGRGVSGGNDGFATALFALDFMHWWAEHGCSGVSVHTGLSNLNGAVYRDNQGNWQVFPYSYGIKAFDVGGYGRVTPVTIANSDKLNLTAYAVTGTNNELYVTIINKEHGPGARSASVTINAGGFASAKSAVMFLTALSGDVEATHGITLGDAPIINDGPWRGQWTTLNSTNVTVPAASAAIVKMSAQ